MMNASDYEFKKREYLEDLKTHLKTIRSFKEVRAVSWAQSIRSSYLFIATYNLLLDDSLEAKKYFFKGAKITSETFKIFKENHYPHLKKKENPPFTALFVNSFLDAILCDSEELLLDYARTIEDMGMTHPPFNYEITYALKYLVLEDFEKARKHVFNAHQPTYFKLPYNGFSHVVKGILEREVGLIDEGIKLRLRYHEKENKNSIFYSTSIEVTALAKLAMRFGLTPDISSSFISKELLKKDMDIQYEGIDEILSALEEANKRSGGFLKQISGWFKK